MKKIDVEKLLKHLILIQQFVFNFFTIFDLLIPVQKRKQ